MSLFEQLNIPDKEMISSQPSRPGVTLAKVTNIDDPEKLGRIRCAIETANKEARELDWAYMMTPFGGKECGFYFMPNVGDLVLVAFESGDVGRPYIIGSLWGSLVKPPLKLENGLNETYMIKTPNKSIIEFKDKKGEEAITVKTPKGRKIEIDDKQEEITLADADNSIRMNGKSGEVTIKCKNKLTITVGSGVTISIDGSGTINMEGKQAVNINGANININAKANATIKGSAQTTVEGGGITVIKGGMVKIN